MTDSTHMPGSFRFQPILDPADPAWYDDAEGFAPPWWHNATLYWLTAAASLVLLVFLVIVDPGSNPGTERRSENVASASVAPVVANPDASLAPVPVLASGDVPRAGSGLVLPSSPRQMRMQRVADPATAARWSRLDSRYMPPIVATPAVLGWDPTAAGFSDAPSSTVTGDTFGLHPTLRAALEQIARGMGTPLEVVSGLRTRDEQEHLHREFLAGTGNLAAVPGTSRHESGQAADVYVNGVALADVPGGAAIAAAAGVGFPVPGEAWHAELVAATYQ